MCQEGEEGKKEKIQLIMIGLLGWAWTISSNNIEKGKERDEIQQSVQIIIYRNAYLLNSCLNRPWNGVRAQTLFGLYLCRDVVIITPVLDVVDE